METKRKKCRAWRCGPSTDEETENNENNSDVFRKPNEIDAVQDHIEGIDDEQEQTDAVQENIEDTPTDEPEVNELAPTDHKKAHRELPRTSTGRIRWAPKKLDL